MSKWHKRVWLNSDKALTGFVAPSVEWTADDTYITADVRMADCNRMITLDFGSSTSKGRAEALNKLTVLQETIQEFRERLVAGHERVDKK